MRYVICEAGRRSSPRQPRSEVETTVYHFSAAAIILGSLLINHGLGRVTRTCSNPYGVRSISRGVGVLSLQKGGTHQLMTSITQGQVTSLHLLKLESCLSVPGCPVSTNNNNKMSGLREVAVACTPMYVIGNCAAARCLAVDSKDESDSEAEIKQHVASHTAL